MPPLRTRALRASAPALLALALLAASAAARPSAAQLGEGPLGEGSEGEGSEGEYPEAPSALIGARLPEVRVRPAREGLDPAAVVASRQRGRVVVLVFLATWCHSCRELSPVLADLHRRRAAEGLSVIAYSHEPRARLARRFDPGRYPFPIGQCTGRAALRHAAVALPTVFVADRAGVVREVFTGANPQVTRGLRSAVDRLLRQR